MSPTNTTKETLKAKPLVFTFENHHRRKKPNQTIITRNRSMQRLLSAGKKVSPLINGYPRDFPVLFQHPSTVVYIKAVR